MVFDSPETCPLPDDPVLAEVARAVNEARAWAQIVDSEWRWAYATDDVRMSQASLIGLVPVPLGAQYFSTEALESGVLGTVFDEESMRDVFELAAPWVLADTPGGRDALREAIHPGLHHLVEAIEPQEGEGESARTILITARYTARGKPVRLHCHAHRIRDADGRLAGTVIFTLPEAGMAASGTMAMAGDVGHLIRMRSVAKAARRPAAILFADLENSSPLSKQLSTSGYFALGRRLVRASDQAVVDNGGLVGRHVGDGVVSFFLAENCGSESAAARSCIAAARDLRSAMRDVATRSDLDPDAVSLRFGLHWGSKIHVGQITTPGRFEVTALGDEVNETSRIEACATGARLLASKDLIERLEPDDASSLEIDPDRVAYQALGELPSATDKARRDAPSIGVCEL